MGLWASQTINTSGSGTGGTVGDTKRDSKKFIVPKIAGPIFAPTEDGKLVSLRLTNGYWGTLPVHVWLERDDQRIDLANPARVQAGGAVELVEKEMAFKSGDILYGQCRVSHAFSGLLTYSEYAQIVEE